MNCDIIIALKHEVIIQFLSVMACILFHSVVISTSPSLQKKTSLNIRTAWANNVVSTTIRTTKNAVFSHL